MPTWQSNILHPSGSAGELVKQLLSERYLLKDATGRCVESPEQMIERVSSVIATVEAMYGASASEVQAFAKEFSDLMSFGSFLPNSPTLMNAGTPGGMLNACFVLGMEDSVEGIFDTVKLTALVQKAGGGTGFALDVLRPTGDIVASSGGTTSGPISFWRVLAEAAKAIQQGAHRRGAAMAMLSVTHPDSLSFIPAKQDTSQFTNFNISVKITDQFMAALESSPDSPHVVVNPRDGREYALPRSLAIGSYGLRDLVPVEATTVPCYSVRDVWNMLVTNAHATGEPGVCFIDRVNHHNPTPARGTIKATNPCGEQPLLDHEACCLGSLNVLNFVELDEGDLDWGALRKAARLGVRFLDNVIDASSYPAPQIREATAGNRKIGLGMMGFADTLALLQIRYDSDEGIELARKLSGVVQDAAHQASEELV